MKKQPKLPFQVTTKNSKILHDTMVTLGALKEQTKLNNLPMNEIQVHLLDEGGDGVILCLEYEEPSGEITKTFSCVDEFYDDSTVEVELEELTNESCNSPENRVQSEVSFIEETISEEYDEIFHNSNSDGKPPLLN